MTHNSPDAAVKAAAGINGTRITGSTVAEWNHVIIDKQVSQ